MMGLKQARGILVAAIVVGAGGLVASCSAPAATGPNPATGEVAVQVATMAVGDIGSRTDYVANVAAKHQVDLAPVGTGVIEALYVDIGDEIQEGRLIAELRHGTLDAQLRRAQAMLFNAQARLAAARAEVAPNRIMAQAEVRMVQQQLADLQVLAPFGGLVSGRWLSPGAVATPQTPIVTLVSQELVVTLHVEEIRINLLRIGDPVTFTSPALPGSVLEMKVDRVPPSGDSQEHTFSVQLRPTGDVPGLKPGRSGGVLIEARHREAVLLLREALVYRANQPPVFRLENNQARLLNVEIGVADTASIEILSGVLPGDRVIVSGHRLLSDGATVVAEDPKQILLRRRNPAFSVEIASVLKIIRRTVDALKQPPYSSCHPRRLKFPGLMGPGKGPKILAHPVRVFARKLTGSTNIMGAKCNGTF